MASQDLDLTGRDRSRRGPAASGPRLRTETSVPERGRPPHRPGGDRAGAGRDRHQCGGRRRRRRREPGHVDAGGREGDHGVAPAAPPRAQQRVVHQPRRRCHHGGRSERSAPTVVTWPRCGGGPRATPPGTAASRRSAGCGDDQLGQVRRQGAPARTGRVSGRAGSSFPAASRRSARSSRSGGLARSTGPCTTRNSSGLPAQTGGAMGPGARRPGDRRPRTDHVGAGCRQHRSNRSAIARAHRRSRSRAGGIGQRSEKRVPAQRRGP